MTRSACFFLLQLFTSTLGWSPGLLGAYITCTVHMSNYQNSSSPGLLNTMWQAQSNHLLKIITIKDNISYWAKRTFLMASRTEFLLCGLSSTVSPTYACAQHLILLEIFLSLQFRIFAITKVICTLRPSLSFQVLIFDILSYVVIFGVILSLA